MEMLLLLLVPVLFGSLFIGGDSDDGGGDTAPEREVDDVTGTDGNDILQGADTDSNIDAGGGDDLAFGNRGDDTIDGGDGVDFLDGGPGNDALAGGKDGDVLAGGTGDDSLSGGQGRDLVSGGAGDDTLIGGAGSDVLIGSTGADALYGGLGNDYLNGVSPIDRDNLMDDELREEFTSVLNSAHGDALTEAHIDRFLKDFASDAGDHAADLLSGGAGSDYIIGDDGDTMTGGGDADYFEVNWVSGNAPVTITDYSDTDEGVEIYVDEARDTVPEFGMRDAADGSGVELLVDEDVVAALADVTVADLDAGQIIMYLPGSDATYTAMILPALTA